MGTGVGEAMLISAAVGGGSAALTGGDPLKGALLGGLTGGVGAGLGGALAGGAGGAAGAGAGTAAGTAAGTTAGTAAGTGIGATGAGLGTGVSASLAPSAALAPSTATGFVGPIDYAVTSAVPSSAGTGFTAANAANTGITGLNPNMAASAITPGAPSSFQTAMSDPFAYMAKNKMQTAGAALAGATGAQKDIDDPEEYKGPLSRFRFNPETYRPAAFAEGGITALAAGGYDRMVGEMPMYPSNMAAGGLSSLGGYSDGGRLLKGPGDGVSDSIPATIGRNRRPARLADGEFVVPARIVSELGNGSTDAGARRLYAMMDRVQKARGKTTGKRRVAANTRADKYLPA
jgi:hypothetical protein